MTIFSGKTITGEQVVLDDNAYRECIFIDCNLIYRGGDVNVADIRTERCTWDFEGPALNTLRFLEDFNAPISNFVKRVMEERKTRPT